MPRADRVTMRAPQAGRAELEKRAEAEQRRAAAEVALLQSRVVEAERKAAGECKERDELREMLAEREEQVDKLERERRQMQQMLGAPNWRKLLAQLKEGSSTSGSWQVRFTPGRDFGGSTPATGTLRWS